MDELSQLKTVLKNSFEAIKKDIQELRSFQEEQSIKSFEQKKQLDKVGDEYVSKDKLNLIKIKIGEINNSLKKIWDVEESIKKLEEKTTSKKEFESRVADIREEIQRALNDFQSISEKKFSDIKNQFDVIERKFDTVKDHAKTLSTKEDVKKFSSEVSKELTGMHKDINQIKSIKDAIKQKELDRRTDLMNGRIDLLANEVLKANKNVSGCITARQAQELTDQINAEFSDVKKTVSHFEMTRKAVSMLEKESASRKEVEKALQSLQNENHKLKTELKELQHKFGKEFARKDDFEAIAKKVSKKESAHMKISQDKNPARKWNILGNTSITLAIVGVAGAVAAFFSLTDFWTNIIAVIALVLFVAGIVFKVIAVRKSRN